MKSLARRRWVMVEASGLDRGWYTGWIVSEDRKKGLLLGTVRKSRGQGVPRKRFEPENIIRVWNISPRRVLK